MDPEHEAMSAVLQGIVFLHFYCSKTFSDFTLNSMYFLYNAYVLYCVNTVVVFTFFSVCPLDMEKRPSSCYLRS